MTKRLGVISGAQLPTILAGQHVKFEDGYVEIDDYIRNLIMIGHERRTADK